MHGITRNLSLLAAAAAAALTLAACEGPTGPAGTVGPAGVKGDTGAQGNNGTAGPTTGTIAGTVTDSVKKDALAMVAVAVKDSGGTMLGNAMTDAMGKFSVASVPLGTVQLSLTKDNYTSPGALAVGVLGGQTVNITAALSEAASGKPSVALAAAAVDIGYGQTTTVTATASDPTGDTLTYTWKNNTTAGLGKVVGNNETAQVTTPTLAEAMKTRLEDPSNPNQYVSGFPLDTRFGIVPVIADTRGTVTAAVTVDDGRGQTVTASFAVDAASVLTGARNVAIGTRVYLNSGHDNPNAWTFTPPQGSTAKLDATDARVVSFVADVKGTYTVGEGMQTMDVFAGDWVGAIEGGSGSSITPNSSCTQCHAPGGLAPDQFTPWLKTGHANMLVKGITGVNGASYGASCIVCHTVGYDKGVTNNGFDDVASAKMWSFPAMKAATNWTDMVTKYPDVAKLGGIQCESCHGPNNSDAHKKTPGKPWASPRISYSSELCATCHASGTGHHNFSEWMQLNPDTKWGHSNDNGARTIGTRGAALNNHCGRCHAAQGYVAWSAQMLGGNPGNIVDANVLAGVTPANVEPITCTACHDPHDVTNPNQLRVYGDTPLLPSGFVMYGMGKGALCITCHNSRNATYTVNGKTATYLHEDSEIYNGGAPTGYSAPHQACQGDVFAGRNAYFMGNSLPMTSKHAAIEDTCVGCHMAKNPEKHMSHGSPATSGHVFHITDSGEAALCAECHGEGVNGEGIKASVEAGIKAIAAKMGTGMATKSNAIPGGKLMVVAYDEASDTYSIAPGAAKNPQNLLPLIIDVVQNPLKSAVMEEIHGQVGFVLTFTSAVSVQLVDGNGAPAGAPKQLTTFGVQLGSIYDGSGPTNGSAINLFAKGSNMTKAGWNYFLIEGDQSLGLHNPTFARTVINNTLAQDLAQ